MHVKFMEREKIYNKGKKQISYFTGQYFKDRETFFALYPTENGPVMYYQAIKYIMENIDLISNIKTRHNAEKPQNAARVCLKIHS